ncbi:ABC transporter ATP-binding protein [Aliterella atlantica]|uniref:ABC transporter ATP-binding protein n=1 Tax=Aliterella atlantica CENA595 TaxID=1618023 RepID=A0A0D8ZTE3_9CYAN|nr:ABC transporter ATP-binding protein [Aliterella atlantica]KJH72038.1 ABC transporter ATP-binding protein [Aliterella atlantica CENA595]
MGSEQETANKEGALVELEHLSKTFQEGETQRTVLDRVSLTILPGEFIVLLGNSGSGKSTLLNLLSGIDQPDRGVIKINGLAIAEMNERSRTLLRRDRIGFVFQFFNLIATLTVLENITLPQELAGKSTKAAQASALRLLEQVELGDRQNTFPDKLSGGQQQRVAIARALAHNPQLVLADEPTGNLDAETGKKVLQILLDLTRKTGKTLIMATHNPEIAKFADRVLRVQDGQLIPVAIEPDKLTEVAA